MKKIFLILLTLFSLNINAEKIVIKNNLRIQSPNSVTIYFRSDTALDNFCAWWSITKTDFTSWNNYFSNSLLKSTNCSGVNIINGNAVEFLEVYNAFWFQAAPPIENLTAIEINTTLDTLNIQQNNYLADNITDLDINTVPTLKYLNCNCNLTTLLTSNNPSLEVINTYLNSGGSINVSNNNALIGLTLDYSSITNLNVSNNSNLQQISLTDCGELPSIDLSQNLLLTQIVIKGLNGNNGGSTSITLPNTSTLIALDMSGNIITSLNLTPYTNLFYLLAEQTLITSLNTSLNTGLQQLKLHGCPFLSDIDITNNIALINVDVSNTALGVSEVNDMFIALDAAGLTGGSVKYNTLPLPTGPGLTAKNNLVSKSWSIIH